MYCEDSEYCRQCSFLASGDEQPQKRCQESAGQLGGAVYSFKHGERNMVHLAGEWPVITVAAIIWSCRHYDILP